MAGDAFVSADYHERWRGWLSDVRIYNRALTQDEVKQTMRDNPDLAWNPRPTNKAEVDLVENALFLNWSLGDKAVQNDVYFGIDEGAVKNADISDITGIYRGRQDANSYTPTEDSELGRTYYWRVDEVNEADPNSPWKGDVWSFSAYEYFVVEDFEVRTSVITNKNERVFLEIQPMLEFIRGYYESREDRPKTVRGK